MTLMEAVALRVAVTIVYGDEPMTKVVVKDLQPRLAVMSLPIVGNIWATGKAGHQEMQQNDNRS